MPYTTLSQGTAGQVYTAAAHNQIVDNLNLLGPAAFNVQNLASAALTTTFSTTSTTFVDVTNLSVSITPSSASSKVLVLASVTGSGTDVSNAGETGYVLVRGSTIIAQNTTLAADFTGQLSIRSLGASTAVTLNHAVFHLDSPATTSAVTYKIQARAAAGTLYINRDGDNAVGTVSSLTVIEVPV